MSYTCSSRLFPIFNKECRTPSRSSPKSKTVKNCVRSSPLALTHASKNVNEPEQMVIDCGQKVFGIVQCAQCGMAYSHGDPADIAMHAKYHKRISLELKFPGWKCERVMQVYDNGDRIVLCLPDDRYTQKKVETVRRIVDEELGFVKSSSSCTQSWQAYPMVTPAEDNVDGCNSEQREESTGVRQQCCDTQPVQAQCGISRIWVLNGHRRKQVASKLLDCVRCCFVTGLVIDKHLLAFSDPTQAGARLAAAYTGRDQFLVYRHSRVNAI